MIRAATPLSILLLIAFALELLAVLSTPIIHAIPLATYKQTSYGVFGFCQGGTCTSINVGYPDGKEMLCRKTCEIETEVCTEDNTNFSLPANTRKSLSYLLVVHPVAAFLTLICLILAVLAHFHSPSHSTRYLLGLVIFMLPTFLVSLLAFLVDILLFIPNVSWGGWIVLAATILILVCGVLTCAMRRTIVSRKARKERIAENAEMSGESYYNRQHAATAAAAISPPPLPQQQQQQPNGLPLANGAPSSNTLPSFSTFDQKSPVHEDDRTPLNTHSAANVSGLSQSQPMSPEDGADRYGPGRGGIGMYTRRGRGGMYNGPMDQYGNQVDRGMGDQGSYGGQYPRTQGSSETMGSQYSARRGGRGGYPPRGYGRGGPYRGRGGPMGGYGRGGMPMGALAPAAGAGVGMVAGDLMGRGRGPPPPSYRGDYPPPNGRGPSPYGPGYGGAGALLRRTSGGSPPYAGGSALAPGAATAYGNGPPSRPSTAPGDASYAHAETPPPMPELESPVGGLPEPNVIGQAIEMDARTGSPARSPVPHANFVRDSDSDVAGMVGLQQSRAAERLNMPTSVSPSEYSSHRAE